MKYYYHATPAENLTSILKNGLYPSPAAGCVFMTESAEEAVRFMYIPAKAGLITEVEVFQIKTVKADEGKIKEVFDHNPDFFKCRCFGFFGKIPPDRLKWIYKWRLNETEDNE